MKIITTDLNILFEQIQKEAKEHPNISVEHFILEMKNRTGNKFVVVEKTQMENIQKLLESIEQYFKATYDPKFF